MDEIYNEHAATKMGVEEKGQVCVMIHSGSRGLGHQVATDALLEMEKAMKRDQIAVNDRQVRSGGGGGGVSLLCFRVCLQEFAVLLWSECSNLQDCWLHIRV